MNDRKRQVLLTAQRLFVEKGFIATSIQDILDESQISKGTFYNYFSSKNECLIAILEHGRDETTIRRQELLIGQSLSDKKILAEQISIRQQVNRDHNLLPIFEAVFHSGDPDLSVFAKNNHLDELSWLASRFVDVYGEKAKLYASDCAVLMTGMLHHMMHVLTANSKDDINTSHLVMYTMRRLDSMIPTIIKTKDQLLEEDSFLATNDIQSKTSQQLLLLLTDFYNSLADEEESKKGKQYIQFMMDEISSDHKRVYLLETVTRSFREAFIDTPHERKVRKIASDIWRYLSAFEK